MVDKQQLNFCNPVGMLLRMQVDPQVDFDINSLPFGSDICIIAAFVDPRFKFQWVETYVDCGSASGRGAGIAYQPT